MTKGWRRHPWPLHSVTHLQNFHCPSSKFCALLHTQGKNASTSRGNLGSNGLAGEDSMRHWINTQKRFALLMGWLCLAPKGKWDCSCGEPRNESDPLKEGPAMAAWLAGSFQLSGPQWWRSAQNGRTFLGQCRRLLSPECPPGRLRLCQLCCTVGFFGLILLLLP